MLRRILWRIPCTEMLDGGILVEGMHLEISAFYVKGILHRKSFKNETLTPSINVGVKSGSEKLVAWIHSSYNGFQ